MVEVKNLDRFMLKLENIANIDLTSALDKAGYLVENQAKVNCPVDTGQLRQSITHKVDEPNAKVEIGTRTEYAYYVHEGTGLFASAGNGRQSLWRYQTPDGEWHSTRGQKPQPFLTDALHQKAKAVEKVINNEISKELKNNGKR